MRLTMPETTIRRLIDRLADERPGSDLAILRDKAKRQLDLAAPNQRLTVEELDAVLQTVTQQAKALDGLGVLTDGQVRILGRLASATSKLVLMRDKALAAREADQGDGQGGEP